MAVLKSSSDCPLSRALLLDSQSRPVRCSLRLFSSKSRWKGCILSTSTSLADFFGESHVLAGLASLSGNLSEENLPSTPFQRPAYSIGSEIGIDSGSTLSNWRSALSSRFWCASDVAIFSVILDWKLSSLSYALLRSCKNSTSSCEGSCVFLACLLSLRRCTVVSPT